MALHESRGGPINTNNVVTGCIVTNCVGDDAINGIGFDWGGTVSSNLIWLSQGTIGKCMNLAGYGLTCVCNACMNGRVGFWQDSGCETNVVVENNLFIGQTGNGIAMGCYDSNSYTWINNLTISGNTIKTCYGPGTCAITIANDYYFRPMSIMNVTISNNTIESYPDVSPAIRCARSNCTRRTTIFSPKAGATTTSGIATSATTKSNLTPVART